MTALTDAIRAHFVTCVDSGRFDGEGLDKLLAHVEALQHRAAAFPGGARIVNFIPASGSTEFLTKPGLRFGVIAADAEQPALEILKANADLEQPAHDAHVRTMEGREAARRG